VLWLCAVSSVPGQSLRRKWLRTAGIGRRRVPLRIRSRRWKRRLRSEPGDRNAMCILRRTESSSCIMIRRSTGSGSTKAHTRLWKIANYRTEKQFRRWTSFLRLRVNRNIRNWLSRSSRIIPRRRRRRQSMLCWNWWKKTRWISWSNIFRSVKMSASAWSRCHRKRRWLILAAIWPRNSSPTRGIPDWIII